jgi:disulfide bond formation protein DsbB
MMQIPSPRVALIGAFALSAALLAGAHGFQHIGGLVPCKLCLYQRDPHWAVVIIAGLGLIAHYRLGWSPRGPLALCALAFSIGAAIAFYHAGVEYALWPGPQSCTGTALSGLSADALVDQLLATPVVRCDEVPWSLFGISMAGYNFLISEAAAIAIVIVLRRAGSPS